MKKILPYSDEKMLYNESTKQYELTLQEVKGKLPNTISDDNVLSYRIKKNSRIVYNFIFSHAHSSNRRFILHITTETEEYRQWIYECLMSQMEADLFNGYNDMGLQPAMSREERLLQKESSLSVDTQNIIYSSIGYGGVNVMAAFPMNWR